MSSTVLGSQRLVVFQSPNLTSHGEESKNLLLNAEKNRPLPSTFAHAAFAQSGGTHLGRLLMRLFWPRFKFVVAPGEAFWGEAENLIAIAV